MNIPDFSHIKKTPIRKLSDYVQRVVDISDAMGLSYGSLWFRGISDRDLQLVPGLVWRKLTHAEAWMIDDFRVSLPAYSARPRTDSWENYALMQHHGLPTRLLDWSKLPLAALFFALDFQRQTGKKNIPAVWIMNPFALNFFVYGKEEILVPDVETGDVADYQRVNAYLPTNMRPRDRTDFDPLPNLPVAIEPPFSNPRLLAQQGCFTVHGSQPLPINSVPGVADHMIRLDVYPARADALREELEQLGFRAEWIYQDLDRLSRRIVRERS